jgi:hypothetical protein
MRLLRTRLRWALVFAVLLGGISLVGAAPKESFQLVRGKVWEAASRLATEPLAQAFERLTGC